MRSKKKSTSIHHVLLNTSTQNTIVRRFFILEITPITFTRAHNEQKNNFTCVSFAIFLVKIALIHAPSSVGTNSTDTIFSLLSPYLEKHY